jgi:hypothetical protein
MSRQKFKRMIQGAIALFIAVALCTALFVPPAAATCPDPKKGVPWMDNRVHPEGDEGGWSDPHVQRILILNDLICSDFWFLTLHFHYVIKDLSLSDNNDKNLLDVNEYTSDTGTVRSREASSTR